MRTIVILLPVLSTACPSDDPSFEVLPPETLLGGMTLDEAGADWWRWAYSVPVDTNPIFDDSGADCSEGQSGSDPFYLAGAFGATLTRTCTVSHDGVFLIPIVNQAWDNCGVAPENHLTDDEMIAIIDGNLDGIDSGSLEIDGEVVGAAIEDFADYRTTPTPYTYSNPATGDGLQTYFGYEFDYPCDGFAAGFYVPFTLAPGEHVIHVTGGNSSVPFALDVTYDLTVQ